ncbi:uncharacterized protein LOC110449794 [Mizuhopecten yessoensis]|uniref:Uncharacterized protein n=1 Tax=Mizuhopecten yessoensis TaxID=6573 RepID=A0A210QQF8_MIZYE|nr:uncharacterized protein LOC110449794 [Mizuhopecten yessoensis]OWF50970.1 hypothetical protein KP79_PYT17306 [Mizuhopecten yessoensis]
MGIHDFWRKLGKSNTKDRKLDTLQHSRHCSSCEKYRTWTSKSKALSLPLSDLRKMKQSAEFDEKCRCESVDAWVTTVNRSRERVDIVDRVLLDDRLSTFSSTDHVEETDTEDIGDSESDTGSLQEWSHWRKQANGQLVSMILNSKSKDSRSWDYTRKAMDSTVMNDVIQHVKDSGVSSPELEGKPFIMYGIPRARLEKR